MIRAPQSVIKGGRIIWQSGHRNRSSEAWS